MNDTLLDTHESVAIDTLLDGHTVYKQRNKVDMLLDGHNDEQ